MAFFGTTDPEILSSFEDLTEGLAYNIADHLPGPLRDIGPGKRYATKYDVLSEVQFHTARGNLHVYKDMLRKRSASLLFS